MASRTASPSPCDRCAHGGPAAPLYTAASRERQVERGRKHIAALLLRTCTIQARLRLPGRWDEHVGAGRRQPLRGAGESKRGYASNVSYECRLAVCDRFFARVAMPSMTQIIGSRGSRTLNRAFHICNDVHVYIYI